MGVDLAEFTREPRPEELEGLESEEKPRRAKRRG
jgi:hypothetical protein